MQIIPAGTSLPIHPVLFNGVPDKDHPVPSRKPAKKKAVKKAVKKAPAKKAPAKKKK